MRKLLFCFCALFLATSGVQASRLFLDTFSYLDGDLVGNDGWVQTSTTTTTPIQVVSYRAVMFTGQDVQTEISPAYNLVDGTPFFIGATINVQSATTSGDYFLHWSPALQNNSYISRVEIRSSGTGFQMGYVETSGTGASLTWGSTVFDFNTDYRMVLQYNPVLGPVNDTADLYMDGNLELSDTWDSGTAEQTVLGTLNLRQASANAAALQVDDLVLATTFAEASVIPEPTSLSLMGGLGLLAWTCIRRRK